MRAGETNRRRALGLKQQGPATKERSVVVGAVERRGRVRASVIGTARNALAARKTVCEFVLPGSMIFTDDWARYDPLPRERGYCHRRINHSERIYVAGDCHTQTIESFFATSRPTCAGHTMHLG
jgi:hypothetical protein